MSAVKSCPPMVSAVTRGEAEAVSKAFSSPSAVSIIACILTAPCLMPQRSSIALILLSAETTSSGPLHLGSLTASGAQGIISLRSSSKNSVSAALIRTVTKRSLKSKSLRKRATILRAPSFSVRATASSRSSSTLSAPKIGACWIIPGASPGMYNIERLAFISFPPRV